MAINRNGGLNPFTRPIKSNQDLTRFQLKEDKNYSKNDIIDFRTKGEANGILKDGVMDYFNKLNDEFSNVTESKKKEALQTEMKCIFELVVDAGSYLDESQLGDFRNMNNIMAKVLKPIWFEGPDSDDDSSFSTPGVKPNAFDPLEITQVDKDVHTASIESNVRNAFNRLDGPDSDDDPSYVSTPVVKPNVFDRLHRLQGPDSDDDSTYVSTPGVNPNAYNPSKITQVDKDVHTALIESNFSSQFGEVPVEINYNGQILTVVGDPLGKGAFGQTFRVQDKDGKFSAVKVLDKKNESCNIDALRREFGIQGKVDNSNVVKVYEMAQTKNWFMIRMDLATGGEMERSVGDLTDEEFSKAKFQLFGALKATHSAGVRHLDLKPENMLYDRKTGVVKLIDFGLAKNVNSTEMNGGWCGTPGYMKCNTEGRPIPITPKSCDEIESYALAITLLRMKTGYDGYHKVAKEIRGKLPMERNSKLMTANLQVLEWEKKALGSDYDLIKNLMNGSLKVSDLPDEPN
ncbi:protein kinase [bacterium]|jgi:hypothetical protein|nr:protein kinase [bacterium]